MAFIQTDLETFLVSLNKLTTESTPAWGTMNAQRMVEHLTECINMSMGKGDFKLLIPEDKVEKAQAILFSEEPMPKGFRADFAPEEYMLVHEELELAVDDFVDAWLAFEDYYESNPLATNLHPYFGILDKKGWYRIHEKHFTHHFNQFRLID